MDTRMIIDWPEMLATAFLAVGLVIGAATSSTSTIYATCFLMGLLFGRLWWRWKTGNRVPIFLSIMTFFFGFTLGTLFADLRIVSILLLLGVVLGYWLHEKKIITSMDV